MYTTDLLVIGSGVGGASAALQAADAGFRVTVLTAAEDPLDSNSFWAQGGIIYKAPGAGERASLEADIKRAGAGRCEEAAVTKLASEGPGAVERFLLPGGLKHGDFSVSFDRKDAHGPSHGKKLGLENSVAQRAVIARWFIAGDGDEAETDGDEGKHEVEKEEEEEEELSGPGAGLALCLEGSHSRPRIIHWGDQTGKAIMESLVKALEAHPLVSLLRGATALDLMADEEEEVEAQESHAHSDVRDSSSGEGSNCRAAGSPRRRCVGAVVLARAGALTCARSLAASHSAQDEETLRSGGGGGAGGVGGDAGAGQGKGTRSSGGKGKGHQGKGEKGKKGRSPGREAGNFVVCRIRANATVLATGGCGEVWEHTSNPPSSRGDGLAMALRAGAQVSNMEFMQFHPTTLYMPGERRFLLTEALRGEGAILLDPVRREAFARRYHEDGELAPRDVVARMILKEMANAATVGEEAGRSGGDGGDGTTTAPRGSVSSSSVSSSSSGDSERPEQGAARCWWGDAGAPAPCCFLDIRHRGSAYLKHRFPAIFAHCLARGLDMGKDVLPVVPAAHYFCGGVATDLQGRTSVPGLFAAGEVSCTGLHGANRLASTSLLEGLVWGAAAANAATAAIAETSPTTAAAAAAAASVAPTRELKSSPPPSPPLLPLHPREQKARCFFGGDSNAEEEEEEEEEERSSAEEEEDEEKKNAGSGSTPPQLANAQSERPPDGAGAGKRTRSEDALPATNARGSVSPRAKAEAAALEAAWGEVKGTMWSSVGIVRRPSSLAAASKRLAKVALDSEASFQQVATSVGASAALRSSPNPPYPPPPPPPPLQQQISLSADSAQRLEAVCGLRNAATVAAAIATAAAANPTSVGTHFVEPGEAH